jgi:flagellar hook-associated protein FlgK
MSFNTAVSGLHAAHKRMEVTGNNIANGRFQILTRRILGGVFVFDARR